MSDAQPKRRRWLLWALVLFTLGCGLWGHMTLRRWQQFANEGRVIFESSSPSAPNWPQVQSTLREFPHHEIPAFSDGMDCLCEVRSADGKVSTAWLRMDSTFPRTWGIEYRPEWVQFSVNGIYHAKYFLPGTPQAGTWSVPYGGSK
jgi:hypothetical protein